MRGQVSFRFRRTVRLFPGVRLHLSCSGASVSLGGPDLIGLKQLINEVVLQRADLQPDYTAALKSRPRLAQASSL